MTEKSIRERIEEANKSCRNEDYKQAAKQIAEAMMQIEEATPYEIMKLADLARYSLEKYRENKLW